MSVVIVYIFGTLSSCKDPGVLIPYSGDPLTDYVETPGFIIELGGDPVKMQLLASKRMTGATGYHERLILDLGTGQGNEGNPKLTGRYFVPIIYPNTAEHQFTIRIWYDQPLGAGRWIKIFSKYNLSEPEAEYSMYSTTNVIYGDFFDRQTNPPHWQLNQSYMGPRYWAVDLNPFRFTLSPDVHTSGNMIENNENAVTASPRIYATVTGGARAIKILADGKQIYKYDIIPEGDANGTFLTNLPENFSFFLPLDLDWLNQKDLVVQAVYPDTTSEVILSGNRSITLFNQLGDQLGKLVLPMDYNPFIKPEMLELYDYETHTLKFKIINAGNQSYKAGIGLSKNLVPLSVTFPT